MILKQIQLLLSNEHKFAAGRTDNIKVRSAIITAILCLVYTVSTAWGSCSDCGSAPSGPTIQIQYDGGGEGNTVDTFMYFVPLVSPTTMNVYTDPNTTLNARIISHESKATRTKFTTTCKFEIQGQGLYEAFFDPSEIIAFSIGNENKPRTLHNLLRSIRVDGPMRGCLEVSGSIQNSQRQVNQITVYFNLDGKSSVTARLYDLKYDGTNCDYENRFNEQLARIDSLSFARGGNPPVMTTEVGAVAGEKENEGILAAFKAMLANWFLPPFPIAAVGNETMMNFGAALDATESSFTFPYAQNLRQSLSIMLAQQIPASQETQQIQ